MVLSAVTPEIEPVIYSAITTKIVLVIEYSGTRYHGFQLQANLPTVQGELEKAIWKLTGERLRVMAASRTDTGVHARGQVVSFRTGSAHTTQTFISGLNYYLPRDIAVKAAYGIHDSFNVRRDAVSREYQYHILNSVTRSPLKEGLFHHVSGRLEVDAMNQACQALIGKHDFASFASDIGPEIKSTVREIYRAEVKRNGELVVVSMVANAFLPHQVRVTVGALIRVGLGKMSGSEFSSIMNAKKSGLAGPTAPAFGLYLMQVNYASPFEELASINRDSIVKGEL